MVLVSAWCCDAVQLHNCYCTCDKWGIPSHDGAYTPLLFCNVQAHAQQQRSMLSGAAHIQLRDDRHGRRCQHLHQPLREHAREAVVLHVECASDLLHNM